MSARDDRERLLRLDAETRERAQREFDRPMLVEAGFKPSKIRCFRHKFGLNTFAVCRLGPDDGAAPEP